MSFERNSLDRRSFLKTVTPAALGVYAVARGQVLIERGRFAEPDLPRARQELLKLANEERLSAGLSQLELDDLAGKVANEHALDMAVGGFLSHWGRD